MDYDDSIKWLCYGMPCYEKQGVVSYRPGIERVKLLCQKEGNPQNNLKVIHIGGTNGKGSTSHMLAAILKEKGLKVGLFTSPHLVDLRERIKIDGQYIEKSFIRDYIRANKNFFERINISFFEIITVMAFLYFKEKKVDIAIMEVGLGGRFDATNIISSPLLSIITQIGYDHMNVLGNTLEEIAYEKAGILKEGIPLVLGPYLKEGVKEVLKKEAFKKNVPIYWVKEDMMDIFIPYEGPLKGDYQKINQSIVLRALDALRDKGIDSTEIHIKKGIKNSFFKGRWDEISEHPKLIADIGHNEDGIAYITRQLKREKADKIHFILGFSEDKEVAKLLSYFPSGAYYYFTSPQIKRGFPIKELEKITQGKFKHIAFFSSSKEAFKKVFLEAHANDLVFVGGSAYLVGELYAFLEEN